MFSNLINAAQAAEPEWTPITLNVPIAGIGQVQSFGAYFQLWYSFAIGAVGVLATVMLMWGGFKWLTSRGNSGVISESKQIIWSALIGVVLAFLSYTILYLVNPRLTTIGLPTLNTTNINVQNIPGSRGVIYGDSTTPGERSRGTFCANGDVVDYNNVQYLEVPAAVRDYDQYFEQYGTTYGVDPDILRAIAAQESQGNPQALGPNTEYGNACGLMQLLPSTAGRSCEELRNNPELSIQLAAQHIATYDDSLRSVNEVFAGYNGGYGTQRNPNGTLPALAESQNCAGRRAYECCINPGGLIQTQEYVGRTLGYFYWLQL
jgi:hypothetical protein